MRTASFLNHTVLVDPLEVKMPVVVDCGSNEGEFAVWASRNFGARVFGYEPDSRLYSKLVEQQSDRVIFFPKAIAADEGTAQLHLGASQCSSIHFSEPGGGETEAVATATLAGEFARLRLEEVDLLKLDIEGAEIEVLRTAPAEVLKRIGQITTEFHDFIRPGDRPAIREIIGRLRSLGFMYLPFSTRTYGDVLFVNRAKISLGPWQRMAVLGRGKFLPGLRRFVTRRVAGQEDFTLNTSTLSTLIER